MGGIVFNCVSLHCLILYYFVWHCITLSGIVLHFGGIVSNCVSLYCLILQLPDRTDRTDQPTMCDIVLHVGCIVLNCVSLYCLLLPLPGRSDRTTMCDTALHVGVYCIESCVIALSGTAAAGSLGSAYKY